MAGLSADAAAAAAVAALFFLATLLAPLSHSLTGNGFKLYIPLGVSTACKFQSALLSASQALFAPHCVLTTQLPPTPPPPTHSHTIMGWQSPHIFLSMLLAPLRHSLTGNGFKLYPWCGHRM
jgi:hypothetical protein